MTSWCGLHTFPTCSRHHSDEILKEIYRYEILQGLYGNGILQGLHGNGICRSHFTGLYVDQWKLDYIAQLKYDLASQFV